MDLVGELHLSPAAVAARLEELRALLRLMAYLSQARIAD